MTNLQHLNRSALWVLLWIAGAIGVVSAVPFLSGLSASVGVSERSGSRLVVTLGLMSAAVSIGVLLAPRVALRAPVFEAAASGRSVAKAFRPLVVPGLVGAAVGAFAVAVISTVFVPRLPAEFTEAAARIRTPLLARLLYGGVTEELLLRFGLMTLFVWFPYRAFHRAEGKVRPAYYVAAIFATATVFGAGHLPMAASLVSNLTTPLVLYIVLGNAAFGLAAGYLYWRHGLEAAMIAHVTAGFLTAAA